MVACNRDPTNYEYGMRPNNDKTIYCMTHAGGQQVGTGKRELGIWESGIAPGGGRKGGHH